MKPTLTEEKKLWKLGYKKVACLDEAGVGPLAGPVTAAAVCILDTKYLIPDTLRDVNDSKKLSSKKREKLFDLITKAKKIEWGIGVISEKTIDKINIKNAAELAMQEALEKLQKKAKGKADFLILDGIGIKNKQLKDNHYKMIVGADAKVMSCSMASILAKVTRDRLMAKYHKKYPKYRFDLHKGYCTKLHQKLLKKYGPCPIHRRSFAPVRGLTKTKYIVF